MRVAGVAAVVQAALDKDTVAVQADRAMGMGNLFLDNRDRDTDRLDKRDMATDKPASCPSQDNRVQEDKARLAAADNHLFHNRGKWDRLQMQKRITANQRLSL